MRTFLFHPALLTLLLFSCRDARDERIGNVSRVFMHDTNEFSFMISDPKTNQQHLRKIWAGTVRFVYDVPMDQLMWAEYHDDDGDGPSCGGEGKGSGDVLIIHIKTNAEVEGAGWDRSERGNSARHVDGTTHVIE